MRKARHAGASRARAIAAVLLFAGLCLRLFFVQRHSFIAGDSLLYQEIAQNWRQFHIYGLSTDALPRPTLIRLPGYPAVLALLSLVFDPGLHADLGTMPSFWPVLYLQALADLGTALLLASLAGRLFGRRARLPTLALACFCPFLANYTAVPLTETFTVFSIAVSYWIVERWRRAPTFSLLALLAASLSFSMLLRPDQALLIVAVLPLLFSGRGAASAKWRPALLCVCLAALPFLVWTARNASTFHVFQPLAPRLANDPGETVPRGFQRWYRTFAVEFDTTQEAYWKYPEEPVSPDDLPRRAFDTPQQEADTRELLHEAAAFNRFRPEIDARFAALAAQRITADPLRYYVWLPVARLTNMLLRPRVEMLPVAERWWRFGKHPRQTLFSLVYAVLSFGYMLLGLVGVPKAWRADAALTASLLSYVSLRCALLLTLDNAEQRYTVEFFPVWILFAAALWGRNTPARHSQ